MKKFAKMFVLLSVVSLLFSVSAFQFGDIVKPLPSKKPVIINETAPIILFDIRGKWKAKLTWDEPPVQDWTITYTGTKLAGTFKAISSPHSHEWKGTYKVSGANVVMTQDPATVETGQFPLNCTGKFKTKNAMEGTFKCGPDVGTWTASRLLIIKPPLSIKKD